MELALNKISETATTITLGWTPPAGCRGYIFRANGKRSSTLDGTRAQVKFAKPGPYQVEALGTLAEGVYPLAVSSFPPASPLPAFTPVRTVACTNQSQLRAAIADLTAGDLVECAAFNVHDELVIANKNLASAARFTFAPGWQALGDTPASNLPSVYMNNCSNIQCVGGNITGDGNQGLRMDSCQNVLWHDVRIHDTAGTGLMVQGLTRASSGMSIVATVTNCGWDLTLDPHDEKGTGNHGCYIGEDSYPVSGRFVLDVYDQPYGAACQLGQSNNIELWIRGRRITKVASTQVAGNVIQIWGTVSALTVHYLEGETLGGRAVDPSGVYTLSGSTVEYGRASGYRLSPAFLGWAGITYQDCVAA